MIFSLPLSDRGGLVCDIGKLSHEQSAPHVMFGEDIETFRRQGRAINYPPKHKSSAPSRHSDENGRRSEQSADRLVARLLTMTCHITSLARMTG